MICLDQIQNNSIIFQVILMAILYLVYWSYLPGYLYRVVSLTAAYCRGNLALVGQAVFTRWSVDFSILDSGIICLANFRISSLCGWFIGHGIFLIVSICLNCIGLIGQVIFTIGLFCIQYKSYWPGYLYNMASLRSV